MLSPTNVEAQIGRGWASLMAERPHDAANQWRPVIGATRDPATLRQMALLYRMIGDAEAEARARAALGSAGGSP
jgi:hypothetical protein